MTQTSSDRLPGGYRVSLRNVIGITLLAVLVMVLLGVIVVQLDPTILSDRRTGAENMLWLGLMATTGVLAATGYVLAWRTSARWGIVGLTPVHPRWILIAVAAAMAVFFVGERTDHLLELGIMQGFRADFAAGIRTETGLLSLLAARCLLFPVALEVYFRGVLLNYLVHRLGTEAGVGISSALFALIFFNPDLPVSMAYGLVYGLLYAILFLRAGSLWAPIAAHATVGAMIVAKLAWA